MTWSPRLHRWVAGALLATMLVAATATVASAGSRGKRHRDDRSSQRTRVVYRDYRPSSTYIVRRSSNGPAIAGFLGGLFLGAALAHAAPVGYVYHDPYCGRHFTSLEVYRTHFHRHRHPGVIRVIERDCGDHVRTYRYAGGDWQACDDGYGSDRGDWNDRDDRDRDWDDD